MVKEERYEFTSKAKRGLFITLGVGVLLTLLSVFTYNLGGDGSHGGGHGDDHAAVTHDDGSHDEEPYGSGDGHAKKDDHDDVLYKEFDKHH